MNLDIIVTHYKEPWSVGEGLFNSIAMQRMINFDDIGVILVNDGEEHEVPYVSDRRWKKIVGIMRPQVGIEVHSLKCPCLKDFPAEQQIPVQWSPDLSEPFTTHLIVETDNRKNITFDVLKVIKDENLFLDQMSVVSKQSSGRIRMEFKAFRKEQVDSVTYKIQQISGVREVKKS